MRRLCEGGIGCEHPTICHHRAIFGFRWTDSDLDVSTDMIELRPSSLIGNAQAAAPSAPRFPTVSDASMRSALACFSAALAFRLGICGFTSRGFRCCGFRGCERYGERIGTQYGVLTFCNTCENQFNLVILHEVDRPDLNSSTLLRPASVTTKIVDALLC